MAVKNTYVDSPGIPAINHDNCKFCKLCITICPTHTLIESDGKVAVDTDTGLGCFACMQCVAICSNDAIAVSNRGIEPGDRVLLPDESEYATGDQLNALLLSRRSIRKFKDRAVEQDVLDRIVDIASTAPVSITPTDVNVVVFNGYDKVHELAADSVKCIRRGLPVLKGMASPIGRLMLGKQTAEMFQTFLIPESRTIVEEWDAGHDKLLYDAPAALYFNGSHYGDEADVGIAVTYAMIAAESLGLGSCIIGSVHPFLMRSKELCEKYGIPHDNKRGIVLILGYPRYKYKHAIRRRFGSVKIM